MATLEQPTAFGPFMRELVLLAGVTTTASYNQVPRIIRGSFACQWNNMIDMMLTPLNFVTAIVAFAVLPCILLSYLLRSMCTLHRALSCPPVMPIYSPLFAMRLAILLMVLLILFYVSTIIHGTLFKQYRFAGLVAFALFLLMINIGQCLTSSITALLALRGQASLSVYSRVKELRSCGELLLTFSAVLQWYTIHGKGHSLSSQGMYQHHSGTTIFGELIIP